MHLFFFLTASQREREVRNGHIASLCSRKLINSGLALLSVTGYVQGLQNTMADAFPICKGISRSAIIGISVMLSKTDPDIRELWSEIRDKNL